MHIHPHIEIETERERDRECHHQHQLDCVSNILQNSVVFKNCILRTQINKKRPHTKNLFPVLNIP
jgi:hypothetical protein